MPHRFIITHLDLMGDRGFVRLTGSCDGSYFWQPIAFTISGVAQPYYNEEDSSHGFRVPDEATLDRVPNLGDELVGYIAADPQNLVFDEKGNPFLRNWMYGDQYDEVQAIIASRSVAPSRVASSTEGEDDYVSTGTVYNRAYAHFGNHEMAREATEMCPGDFI